MRIGIDISQLAYPNTGVANYLEGLLSELLKSDRENEYILFYSSLRTRIQNSKFKITVQKSKLKHLGYRHRFLILFGIGCM